MRFVVIGILCGLAVGCNEMSPTSTTEPVDRSNTGVNVRDRDSTAKTPLDQNENQADINITADIRKQVVDSKMSVAAENVKIITQDGMVTLRGPVDTEQEKQSIEAIAKKVSGRKQSGQPIGSQKLRDPILNQSSGAHMEIIAQAIFPLAAIGYSLVWMLAGGGILGAVVIFAVAKMAGK